MKENIVKESAQKVLTGYRLAIVAFESEQTYLEDLVARLNNSKTLIQSSGMSNATMADKMEQIIFELQEQEEVIVGLAKDCADTLREAERLISSLGNLGIRERWRAILKMRYLQHVSWRGIAARLGMDQRNVRDSHDAALKYLDALLNLRSSRS